MPTESQLDRVILFGAGASLSEGIVPEAPPLGRQLFQALAGIYPRSWGALPTDIREQFERGFEQGMQILWDKYSTNIAELMQQMAIYFAQFRPDGSGIDLYSQLFREIKKSAIPHGILYSTLNYEPVIELAAGGEDLAVSYGDAAADSNVAPIWKLHGSCNFLSKGLAMSKGVKFSSGIVIDGGLEAVNPSDAIQYCLSGSGLYPAMALYMEAKPIQVGRREILAMQHK